MSGSRLSADRAAWSLAAALSAGASPVVLAAAPPAGPPSPAAASEPAGASPHGSPDSAVGDLASEARSSSPQTVPELDADSSSAPVEEVVVTARALRPVSASYTRVDAYELSAIPRRTAEDALRLVPGFTLVQHGSEGKGHQFFLRGFDAEHGADLEVTVDGIPVNEWSNVHAQGYLDLGFIIGEAIDSVEVVKGPFSLEQGPFAMAGSARYRLGIPAGLRGLRATVTAGSTLRRRAVLTYTDRDGDGLDFVALEAVRDDGFGQNREIERLSALARQRLLDSRDWGVLSLLVSGYAAGFALPGSLRADDLREGNVGFYDAYDPEGQGDSKRGLAGLNYERIQGNSRVSARVYGALRRLDLLENFTGFLIDPVNGDRRQQQQRGFRYGGSVEYERALSERLRLVAGLGLRGDEMEQSQSQRGQQLELVAAERSLEVSQQLAHLRLGALFEPTESLRVSAGARVDWARFAVFDALAQQGGDEGRVSSQLDALMAVSPRVQLDADLGSDWAAFVSYGRGVRPPEARAFSSFVPNQAGLSDDVLVGAEPSMTSAEVVELGARVKLGARASAQAAVFATFLDRELILDHVSGVSLELSGSRRLGAELQVEVRPARWLELHADAALTDARFTQSGNTVPLVPRVIGSARAQFVENPYGQGLRASIRAFGLAPRPLPNGARGATLVTLDATTGYDFEAFRLDLELENVLDRRLREGEFNYASSFVQGTSQSQLPALHYVAGAPFNARLSLTFVY